MFQLITNQKTIIEILEKVKKENGKIFNLQVIVVDDGSTDSTEELLKKNDHLYDSYSKLKTNQGKGAAVKKGLSIATGDYILFKMLIWNIILQIIKIFLML